MIAAAPSRTALAAALHRAAHQVAEQGRIFHDPLALRILGADARMADPDELIAQRGMRLFIAIRSRVAADRLEEALQRGVRQVVILGAGLDTTAYRGAWPDAARIYEVDHPATQAWKRARLAAAAIAIPAALTFVPIDFERQSLLKTLQAAGFDPTAPSFFLWLGVVPYLTEGAIFATLGAIASLPGGAGIVFDYANPPGGLADERRRAHEARAGRVAALGEPWISYFDSDTLHARLTALGFGGITDLGAREIAARYLLDMAQDTSRHGGHILHATRGGR